MTDKIKILLIDDDTEYIDNFGWFLERKGYEVFKAGCGKYGLEVIEKERPQIVLCDLLMLDINGDEVIVQAKTLSPNTIFIIVSAYLDEKTKERLRQLGAYSFIEKIVRFKPTEEYIRKTLDNVFKIGGGCIC